MRNIKFRGLDKEGKWHYGYFWIAPDNTYFIKEKVWATHFADFKVIPETVGQYIERKDKNGKEIYEGDIVKSCEYIAEVKFGNPKRNFLNVDGLQSLFYLDLYGGCLFGKEDEIIGNIYENNNLLDERK